MSTRAEELSRSFDLLPEPERHQVASEILRRTFISNTDVDEERLAALYAEFAQADVSLAEEGIEDYKKGLQSEDGE